MRHLAQRCELTAIQVTDPAEEQLNNTGRLRLRAPGGGLHVVDSGDARLRQRYAEVMAQRHAALKQVMHGAGVALVRVSTQEDTLRQLDQLL